MDYNLKPSLVAQRKKAVGGSSDTSGDLETGRYWGSTLTGLLGRIRWSTELPGRKRPSNKRGHGQGRWDAGKKKMRELKGERVYHCFGGSGVRPAAQGKSGGLYQGGEKKRC